MVQSLGLPQLRALFSGPRATARAPLPAVSSSGYITWQKTPAFFSRTCFLLVYLPHLALCTVK